MYTGQLSFHTSRDYLLNRGDIIYVTGTSPFEYLANSDLQALRTHDLTVKNARHGQGISALAILGGKPSIDINLS